MFMFNILFLLGGGNRIPYMTAFKNVLLGKHTLSGLSDGFSKTS